MSTAPLLSETSCSTGSTLAEIAPRIARAVDKDEPRTFLLERISWAELA